MSLKTETIDLSSVHVYVGSSKAYLDLGLTPKSNDNFTASPIALWSDTTLIINGDPADGRSVIEFVSDATKVAVDITRDPMLYNKVVKAEFRKSN